MNRSIIRGGSTTCIYTPSLSLCINRSTIRAISSTNKNSVATVTASRPRQPTSYTYAPSHHTATHISSSNIRACVAPLSLSTVASSAAKATPTTASSLASSSSRGFPSVARATTVDDIRTRDPYLPINSDGKEKLSFAYWFRRLSRVPYSWHYSRETLMAIDKQASRDEFFNVIGLPREFPQEQALRVLHLWMVTLRLNSEEYNRKDLAYMFDLFW